jgi:hypothetical protein
MAVAADAGRANGRALAIRAVLGFIAGAVGVLVFQQAVIGVLQLLGVIPGTPYNMRPAPPFGVPQVFSSAFWGGVWGVLFALASARLTARAYWAVALLFGAVLLPLVGWFVVAPLKGLPAAGGWQPSRMLLSVLINGVWGLGAGAALLLLQRLAPGPSLGRRA